MSWYEFLLFVHVACAIIWIGGGFLFQVYGMVELRSGDTAAIARFAGNAGRIGERLFVPASLLVVLAGIGLMIEGSWSWGTAVGRLRARHVRRARSSSGSASSAPTAKRIEAVGPETDGRPAADPQGLLDPPRRPAVPVRDRVRDDRQADQRDDIGIVARRGGDPRREARCSSSGRSRSRQPCPAADGRDAASVTAAAAAAAAATAPTRTRRSASRSRRGPRTPRAA